MSTENDDVSRRVALLRRAAEVCPVDVAAHRDLGWLLLELKRYEEALPFFRKAMTLAPNDVEVWRGLMRSYAMSDMAVDAMALGEDALKLWPREHEFRFNLAVTYLDNGRPHDAAHLFSRLVRNDPESPVVHAMAGVAFASIGRKRAARREQMSARQLGGEDPAVERLLGEIDEILGSGPKMNQKSRSAQRGGT